MAGWKYSALVRARSETEPVVGKVATVSGSHLSPADIGVGMRISIHPHQDTFESTILTALDATTRDLETLNQLTIETGPVSTYVGATAEPAAQALADYAHTLINHTVDASGQAHVVVHLLLSRGCPGEASCELIPGTLPAETPVHLDSSGLNTTAAWSLYPLADDGTAHMGPIMSAIERARNSGVQVTSEHYATHLHGDLAQVLALIFDTWAEVGVQVPHTVAHATLSLNSPSTSADAGNPNHQSTTGGAR